MRGKVESEKEGEEMKNKDGSEDLRKYGPFNVDRSPTGQFVSKGSIDNPIEEFSEPKEKLKEIKHGEEDETVKKAGAGSKNRRK